MEGTTKQMSILLVGLLVFCAHAAPSENGKALYLPGGQVEQYAYINPFTFSTEFTIEASVTSQDPTNGLYWFSYATSSNDNCLLLMTTNLPVDEFSTVHFTYSSGVNKYYINGVEAAADIHTSYCGEAGGSVLLGHDQDSILGGFVEDQSADVMVDYFAIYDYVFSDTDIAARASAGCSPDGYTHGVVVAFDFDEEATSYDNNGQTLTVVGAPTFATSPNDCVNLGDDVMLAMEAANTLDMVDQVSGASYLLHSTSAALNSATYENHLSWDISVDSVNTADGYVFGDQYTHAYWVYWRSDDAAWRTLARGSSSDHCTIVLAGGTELGMYSNRMGGFYGSGHSIVKDEWRFVVVTGSADGPASASGTTTFFVGSVDEEPTRIETTAPAVCSGETMYSLGYGSNQAPGHIAKVFHWNRVLTEREILTLHAYTKDLDNTLYIACAAASEPVFPWAFELNLVIWGQEVGWTLFDENLATLHDVPSGSYGYGPSTETGSIGSGDVDASKNYMLKMYDSYGDGWHGADYNILRDPADGGDGSFIATIFPENGAFGATYWQNKYALIIGDSSACPSSWNGYTIDGCTDISGILYCGDAYLETSAGELCDDGNSNGGDGCSADCYPEFDWVCYDSEFCSTCTDVSALTSICVKDVMNPADPCGATRTTSASCLYSAQYVANGNKLQVSIVEGLMTPLRVYGYVEGYFCAQDLAHALDYGSVYLQITINGAAVPGLRVNIYEDFASEGSDCACHSDYYPSTSFGFPGLTLEQQDFIYDNLLSEGNVVGFQNVADYYSDFQTNSVAGATFWVAKFEVYIEWTQECGNGRLEGEEACDDPDGCTWDCASFVAGYGCTDGVDCEVCASDQYGTGGECLHCPENAVPTADSTSCVCTTGYESADDTCVEIHGDGLVVGNEQCDSGSNAGCVDGLVDSGFYCDDSEPSVCARFHFEYDTSTDTELTSSSAEVTFTSDVRFGGTKYSSVHITDQGLLNFDASSLGWNGGDLSDHVGNSIVAAYFSEWGSYTCGGVWYRHNQGSDLADATTQAEDMYGMASGSFAATDVLIVTYLGEALGGDCDAVNYVQVVLVASPFRTIVMLQFSLNSVQWDNPAGWIGVSDGSESRVYDGTEESSVSNLYADYATGIFVIRCDRSGGFQDPQNSLSTDGSASSISDSGSQAIWSPGFETNTLSYTLTIEPGLTSTFTGSGASPEARVYVDGTQIYPGDPSASYDWGGAETVTVSIQPGDTGTAATEYVLNVEMVADTDSGLASVSYTLDDDASTSDTVLFDSISYYSINSGGSTTEVTFTAVTSSPEATVALDGTSALQTLTVTQSVAYGEETSFLFEVTAEDGSQATYNFVIIMVLDWDTSYTSDISPAGTTGDGCNTIYSNTQETATIVLTCADTAQIAVDEDDFAGLTEITFDFTSDSPLELGQNFLNFKVQAENGVESNYVYCIERTPSSDTSITELVLTETDLIYTENVDVNTLTITVDSYWSAVTLSVTTDAVDVFYYDGDDEFVGSGATSNTIVLTAVSNEDSTYEFKLEVAAQDGTLAYYSVFVVKSAADSITAPNENCVDASFDVTYPETRYFAVPLDRGQALGFDYLHVTSDSSAQLSILNNKGIIVAEHDTKSTLAFPANNVYYVAFQASATGTETKNFQVCAYTSTAIPGWTYDSGSITILADQWAFYAISLSDYYLGSYAVELDTAQQTATFDAGTTYTVATETTNGGFEDDGAVTTTYVYMAVAGWDCSGTIVIAQGSSAWHYSDSGYGDYYVGIQSAQAFIGQTVNLGGAGETKTVSVSFMCARRNREADEGALVRLYVDGVVLSGSSIACEIEFARYELTFSTSEAAVLIEFHNDSPDGDRTIFLDDISFNTFIGTDLLDTFDTTSSDTLVYATVLSQPATTVLVAVYGGDSGVDVELSTRPTTPEITSVSPLSASTSGGTLITVYGNNFETGLSGAAITGTVSVGGATCTDPFYSSGSIICSAPVGSGAADVVVTLYDQASDAFSGFQYNPPTINNIITDAAPTAGGFSAEISGTNFGSSPTVTFGDTACTDVVVSAGDTSITCIVGEGHGSATVTVEVDGLTATFPFSYDSPNIDSLTADDYGTDGAGSLTVTGSNFGDAAASAEITVDFGEDACAYVSHTHTQIICDLPAGVGSNSVSITVAGLASNSKIFTYTFPTISSFDPNPVPAAATTVTINGDNFGASDADLTVTLLGGTCTVDALADHNSIECSVPTRGDTARTTVTVSVGGASVTSSLSYATPTISAIDPSNLPTDGGDVEVQGSNFLGSNTMVVLGSAIITPSDVQDDAVTFACPAGTGTDINLEITVGGLTSAEYDVSYSSGAITGVTYSEGGSAVDNPRTDGTTIATITGTSFGGSADYVFIGNTQLAILSWSDTEIVATVCEQQGTSDFTITVSVSGQTATFNGIYAAPVISSISPTELSTQGGYITITGYNFATFEGTVELDGAESVVVSWTETKVITTVPVGSGSGITLKVTQDGLADDTTYGYTNPTLTSITGDTFPTGGSTAVTVKGDSFDVSGTVTVAGNTCSDPIWDHGEIRCTLPEGSGLDQAVVVTTAGGSTVSGTISYDPPAILSVTPSSFSAPGEQLVVSGINFGVLTSDASISIDSAACTVVSLDHEELTCETTAYPTSSSPAMVVTYDGQVSPSFMLGVGGPSITSIEPESGISTAGGVELTLHGQSFGDGTLVTQVLVGGLDCTNLTISQTQVTCYMPAGLDTVDVSITVGDSTSFSPTLFTYARPVITSLTASEDITTEGGVEITLAGSSLGADGTIKVDGTTVTTTAVGHTEMKFTLGVGTGTKSVTVIAGSQTSAGYDLSYANPVLGEVENDGTASTDGTEEIGIYGSYFGTSTSAVTVTIDGISCAVTTVAEVELKCIPAAASGANLDVIISVSGLDSNTLTWSFAPPVITDVTGDLPTEGFVRITIAGTNLGPSGSVLLSDGSDTKECSVYSWDHTAVQCWLPAWQGEKDVILTTGAVDSAGFSISYNTPTITSITPSSVPTAGTLVTIKGTDFSTDAVCDTDCSVTFEGAACDVSVHTHTQIQCTLPEGNGGSSDVTVTTASGIFATYTLAFDAPVIYTLSPALAPTSSGEVSNDVTPMIVTGLNFGSASSNPTMSIYDAGGSEVLACKAEDGCFQSHNHTALVLENFHPYIGTGLYIVVTLEDTDSTNIMVFDYIAPEVTGISGCTNGDGTGCDLSSQPTITLTGTNFGPSDTTDITVTITDGEVGGTCTNVVYEDSSGTSITCDIPTGRGNDIPITIDVGGQVVTAPVTLSYQTPELDPGTFRLASDSSGGNYTGTNIETTDTFVIEGNFFGSAPALTYGPTCLEYTASVTSSTTQQIEFTLVQPTAGQYLKFMVYDEDTLQYSKKSTDQLFMPEPVFVDNTICLDSQGDCTSVGRSIGVTSSGDFVRFQITNVGDNADFIKIYHGNEGAWDSECTQVGVVNYDSASSTSTINCKMSQSVGSDHTFKVLVNNWLSAASNDVFDYPQIPGIDSVATYTSSSICTDGTDGNVYDCPTIGGERVMIYGTAFATDAQVFVGGLSCTNLIIEDISDPENAAISCVLPGAVGEDMNIIVSSGPYLSPTYTGLIGYAAPTLTTVFGCTDEDSTTIDCDRNGGDVLTITGANFGASDSVVLIGGDQCSNPAHNEDQTEITCTLPTGIARSTAVIVLQNQGQISANSLSIGYAQCQPGYYEANETDYGCTTCPAGTYTSAASATECLICSDGTYSAATASSCEQCQAGKYSASDDAHVGPTECTSCSPGQYSPASGQAVCTDCSVGKYSDVSDSMACTDCPAGTHQTDAGADGCTNCSAGLYAPTPGHVSCIPCVIGSYSGEMATGCILCEPGTAQPFSEASDCNDCAKGTSQASYGQATCLQCDAGRYTNVTGMDECIVCGAGTYSLKLAQSCIECDAGMYSGSSGQEQCLVCGFGTYSSTSGQSTCLDCERGKIADGEMQTECSNCTVGYIAPYPGSYVCDACAVGKYTASEGQDTCTSCAAGTFASGSGATECDDCASGYYALTTGLSSCDFCEAGYYSEDTVTACVACSAGTYSNTNGQTGCTDCPIGSYTSMNSQTTCEICEAGKFAQTVASLSCASCAAGTHTDGATGAANCSDCSVGFIAPSIGTAQCVICTKGSYAPSEGLTACTSCEVGKYVDADGQSGCDFCPEGEFVAFSGQASCVACSAGRYSNETGSTYCHACTAGSRQASEGQTTCADCSTGKATAVEAQVACDFCLAGTFSDVEGQSECADCPSGRACGSAGCVSCTTCGTGTYSIAGALYCSECEIGTFQNATEADSCSACPAGSHQPSTGMAGCILCAAGEFQSAAGQGACEDCSIGFFSAEGASICDSCPEGTKASTPGLSECTPCAAGEFGAGSGSGECSQCPAGSYSDSEASTTCTSCEAGSAQAQAGQSSCDLCPAGKYMDAAGAEECITCSAGRYSDSENSTECQRCDAGYYCPTGATQQTICDAGYYSASGQSSCLACEASSYSESTGSENCVLCAAGTYSDALASTECLNCTAGSFAYSIGSTTCEDCAAGDFSATDQAADCVTCPAGFISQTGASSCESCEAGSFSGVAGQSECEPCGVGFYNTGSNETQCYACDLGTVQPSTAQTECVDCAMGKMMSSTGQAVCIECDAGWFSNDTASTECVRCPVGTYSTLSDDGEGPSECTVCSIGKYSNSPGQVQCFDCLLGKYSADVETVVCSGCDAGRFAGDLGRTVCTNCAAGTYTAVNSSYVCSDCLVGSYAPLTGLTSCTKCSAGRVQNTTGMAACVSCQTGKYASSPGMIACEDCGAGEASSSTGNAQCTLCSPGYYTPTTASTECLACEAGMYQSASGQFSCELCEPGRVAANTASQSCTSCGVGQYQHAYGAEECIECEIGKANALSSQPTCVTCEPGTYAQNISSDVCTSCTAGSYTSFYASVSCTLCESGKYQDIGGQSSCVVCAAGTATNETGRVGCDLCDLGRYQSVEGRSECVECAAGTKAAYTGATTCSKCTAGSSSLEGAHSCTACLAGTYQDAEGASTCDECVAGKYSAASRAVACESCMPGTYANASASTGCLDCEIGTAQSSDARAECDACNAGTYADVQGLSTCFSCEKGSISNSSGASGCTMCESGSYAAHDGATECANCGTGEYQPSSGASECFDCAPGAVASIEGQDLCDDCPAGSYSNSAVGQIVCRFCEQGKYSAIPGSGSCAQCSSGKYSLFGASECTDCALGTAQDNIASYYCDDCTYGTYSDTTGRDVCGFCAPGQFGNETVATTCYNCQTGRYSSLEGTVACDSCIEGSYQDDQGQTACKWCSPGYWGNITGLTSCNSCSPGTYSSVEGSSSCTLCEAGLYQDDPSQSNCKRCPLGTASNETGAQECTECEPGYYQDRDAQVECLQCLPGYASSTYGAEECVECEPGKFGDAFGQSVCISCPGGYAQDEYGSTSCEICAAGYYADEGSSFCSECGEGSVSPDGGTTACFPCDANSVPNEQRTACLCDIGYAAMYDFNNVTGLTETECVLCPVGAVCDYRGVEWSTMEAATGYWEGSDGEYYRCLLASHCEGGTSGEQCADNRVGALCALCADNYTESATTGECEPCKTSESAFIWTAVAGLVAALLLFMNFLFVHKSAAGLLDAAAIEDKIMEHANQDMKSAEDGTDFNDEYDRGEGDVHVSHEEIEQVIQHLRHGSVITIMGPPSPKPNFLHKFKILLGFIQILTNFSLALEIDYPDVFIGFVNIFNPANLNFVEITSVDCISDEINYYWEFQMWLSIPALLIFTVILFLYVPATTCCKLDSKGLKRRRRETWRLVIFSLFLVYPSVSASIFALLVCKEIEGVYYLQADFSVQCHTPEWQNNVWVAIIFVFVYPIGIPACILKLLSKYHRGTKADVSRLEEKGIRAQLGFLYDGFQRHAWYFELFDMVHKLYCTSLIAFFPRDWQMSMAMVGMYLYLAAILLKNPYVRKGDDMLHQVAQIELIMIVMSGNVFNNPDEVLEPTMDFVLGLILIAMTVGLFSWFGSSVGVAMYKSYKMSDVHKAKKASRLDAKTPAHHAKSDTKTVSRFRKEANQANVSGIAVNKLKKKKLAKKSDGIKICGAAYSMHRSEITTPYQHAQMQLKRLIGEQTRL